MRPRALAGSHKAILRRRRDVPSTGTAFSEVDLPPPATTSILTSSTPVSPGAACPKDAVDSESISCRIAAVRQSLVAVDDPIAARRIPSLCSTIKSLVLLPNTDTEKIHVAQHYIETAQHLNQEHRLRVGEAVLEVLITVGTAESIEMISKVAAAGGEEFMVDIDPSISSRVADVVLGLMYASGGVATPSYLEGVPSRVLIGNYIQKGLPTSAQSMLVRYPEPIANSQDWLPLCMRIVCATTSSEGLNAGYEASVAVSNWSRLLPAHVAAGWVLNTTVSDGSLQAALNFFTGLLKRRVLISWQPAVRLVKECTAHGIPVDEFVEAAMWSLPLSARLIGTLATTHPWNALRLLESTCVQNPHFTLHRQTTRVEVRAVLALIWDRSASNSVYRWLLQEMELFVQPWRCYSCFGFNKGHTFTCVRCHSIAPPWQCTCGTWNTGGGVSCRKCSGSIDSAQWKGENSVHWSCGECLTKNVSTQSSCKACAAERKPLIVRDRTCECCLKDLSSSVEPWCNACGWISADESTSLWRCQWCKRLNPWTSCACRFCKEPNYGAAPSVKWFQWVCPGCNYNLNPAWSNRCGSCDAEHDPIGTTRPKCRLCASHVSEDLKCPTCGSGSERWMCLHNGCLTINEEFASSCSQCTRKRADLAMQEDLVLGYTVDEPTLRMRAARVPATPPQKCKSCGVKLPCGVLQVCPKCSTTEIVALPRAAHWKLLGLLTDKFAKKGIKDDTQPSASTLASVPPIVDQLCRAEPDQLPWRGRDLESGLLCVSKDNPVYRDGTTHSSLNSLRDTVTAIVSAAAQPESTQQRVALLKSALSLVSLANSTTRFDELGFDVVWPLMVAVRGKTLDADTEALAKHEYLMEMKLSVGFMLGKAVCPICLERAPCTNCHRAS